jgi:peptidoglycan/xylan/chitin deacetylase (PgdA/CDA1 family)
MFAGDVGSSRLLRLFEKYDLRTTWFIPGPPIETFPEQMKMVVEGGHEVRHPRLLVREPGLDDPTAGEGCHRQVRRAGRGPDRQETRRQLGAVVGASDATNEILLEYGYKYDRSLQHNDFTPYWLARRRVDPVDYSQPALRVDETVVRGEEIDLVKNRRTGTWTTCPR